MEASNLRRQSEECKGKSQLDNPYKLKPIDVKDIWKPDKCDNNIAKLATWYERFRDLLGNRNPNWEPVFDATEKAGKTRIASVEDFLNPCRLR